VNRAIPGIVHIDIDAPGLARHDDDRLEQSDPLDALRQAGNVAKILRSEPAASVRSG
jgi:hypothetical protein